MQLPYEPSRFGRNYPKFWIATEKSGETHPAVGDSLCDRTHPVVWRSQTRCSTESNPSIRSNDSDPSYLFTQHLWKKTTTRMIQAKNPPIHPRNSRFWSGLLVFPKPNQGTPARICTKTFPTLIGRNSLVVVWSRSVSKGISIEQKKPGPTFHGILVGSWREPFLMVYFNPYITG